MPPIHKGRKKGAALAKNGNNGIDLKSTSNGIEEELADNAEVLAVKKPDVTESVKGLKKDSIEESEDKANGDPSTIDEEEPDSEAPLKEESTKVEPDVIASGDVEPMAGKRGRKKAAPAVIEAREEAESTLYRRGRKKAGVPDTEEVVTTEAKEPEKALGKRGRKKAATAEVVEDKEVPQEKEVPEKALAKRGRKKAVVVEVEDDEGVPEEIKEEAERPLGKRARKKVIEENPKQVPVGKRGRKKGAEPVEIDITDSNDALEKVAGKRGQKKSKDEPQDEELESDAEEAPPAKRAAASRKAKIVDKVEEDDIEDFVPRKTRGGRNAKEVAPAPAPKGRKRKVAEEKAESKPKKGKAIVEDSGEVSPEKVDETKQVKVMLKRDHDIDEMARSSLDVEKDTKVEGKDTKVKTVKGPAKSGRKRANQDPEDSKPEKVQKEEPTKAKGGAKKPQIPDVTALDFGNTSKTPGGEPWNLKIASWNVNGIRAWIEKNGLSYLRHEKPDILCVQETKCSAAKLPAELYMDDYYCHWVAGDKEGYSGVGLISKEKPLIITEGLGIEEHDNEGRVITAEYEKFYLVTVYTPNSGKGLVRLEYRKKWDEAFRAYIKTLDEKKPVILCGDLNVSHEEIDIANPKTNKKNAGFTQEERDGFSALLKEGFVDTFRQLYPDTRDAYTFWTYMMNARLKNIGWRLDYFVISERLKDNLCDSLIRKDVQGSDHCPVALFLNI